MALYEILPLLVDSPHKGPAVQSFAVFFGVSMPSCWTNSQVVSEWDALTFLWHQCSAETGLYFTKMQNIWLLLYEKDFDGLMEERRNSIANALELRLSSTNPSIWSLYHILMTNSMISGLTCMWTYHKHLEINTDHIAHQISEVINFIINFISSLLLWIDDETWPVVNRLLYICVLLHSVWIT